MEALPFVDDISRTIFASPERTWDALERLWQRPPSLPQRMFARALGCSSQSGFSITRSERPHMLELRGNHRFSTYALVFELDEHRVHARTFAEFPGTLGRLYRALVIGTGGHRIIVNQMLARIANKVQTVA